MSGSAAVASTTGVPPAPPPSGPYDDWVHAFSGVHPASYLDPAKAAASGIGTAVANTAGDLALAGAGQVFAAGMQALKSFTGDHFSVEIDPVGQETPPRFAIRTTIHFEIGNDTKVAGGAARLGELESRETANQANGASAYVKASETYTHEMSAEEAQSYVDCIKANGHGGKLLEQKVLVAGFTQGWKAAQEMAQGITAKPEAAMRPGDELKFQAEAGFNVKVGGTVPVAGMQVGAVVRTTATHKVTLSETMLKDGSIQFKASVADYIEATEGLNVGASEGVAKLGLRGKELEEFGKTGTVVFVLQKDNPEFDALKRAVMGVKLLGDLEALSKAHKDLLSSTTDTSHSGLGDVVGGSASLGLDVAGKPLEIDAGASVMHKSTSDTAVTKDGQGHITHAMTDAASRAGAAATVNGNTAGFQDTSHLHADMDKDGKVVGTEERTSTGVDLAATGKKMSDAFKKDGIGAVKDLGQDLVQKADDKKVSFGSADLQAISAAAADEGKWRGLASKPQQAEWVKLGEAIRAAQTIEGGTVTGFDAQAALAAVAGWDKDTAHRPVLDMVTHPGGEPADAAASATPPAFGFPADMASLQPVWDEVVAGDPLVAAKQARADNQLPAAVKAMIAAKDKLSGLKDAMKKGAASWAGQEASYKTMLGQVDARLKEIATAAAELKASIPAKADAAAS